MTLILRNKNLLKKKLFCLEKRRNIKQTEKSIIKMEHYKISKLLNDSTVLCNLYQKNRSKEMIYQVEKNIRFKTSMLRSDLCDYSDAYFTRKNKGYR